MDGRQLLALLSSQAGSEEALATAIGVESEGEQYSRLAAAVKKLPIGRPSPRLAAAAKALKAAKALLDAKPTAIGAGQPPVAPAVLAPLTPPGPPVQVVVLIVGLLRDFLLPRVFDSQKFLLQPLQQEYGESGGIHLFICADSPNAEQLRGKRIGETMAPTAVFEHTFEGRHNQWPRMAACYRDVQKWATARGHWGSYRWIVRSRPDNIFFAPVPSLRDKATDAVHGRVRRFGGHQHVGDESMSWWHYDGKESVCGAKQEGNVCRWHDTAALAEGAECLLLDDQFGYVPAGSLAAVYFGVAAVGGRAFKHFPLVHGNEKCQWPEGALTCRLLEAPGGRLEMMAVSFRIVVMTKLNNGRAPPTTNPSMRPHVCIGSPTAGVQRPVSEWSVDDVLVWLVDSVRVSGGIHPSGSSIHPSLRGSSIDYRAKVVELQMDGRQLLSWLEKGQGGVGVLATVIGVGMGDGEQYSRLADAVKALPAGR